MFSRRGGGGRAGKKLQVCPCVTLQSWFLLPFVAISVHSCWRDLRNKQEAGMLSSSSTLLKFSLFATFHVANSGHQTLKYIGESNRIAAWLIWFFQAQALSSQSFATDKDDNDYCSFEWCGPRYLDMTQTTSPRICCKLGQCPMAAGIPIDFSFDFRWRQPWNDGLCSNDFAWLLDTVFSDQVQTKADKQNVKKNIIWDSIEIPRDWNIDI